MDVTATNPSANNFSGSESPGTTIQIDAGSYSVAESGGPSGYTLSSSVQCSGTAVIGGSYTCTITNDDQAATLTVIKTVVNDNGGTAGRRRLDPERQRHQRPRRPPFAGAESPGTTVTLDANAAYSVTETGPSGYTETDSAGCSSALRLRRWLRRYLHDHQRRPAGQPDDHQARRERFDRHGDGFHWNMLVTAASASSTNFPGSESRTTITIDAGSYSVAESVGPSGYTASSVGCSGTAVPGGTYTCTITNDQNPTVTINQAPGQADPTNVAGIHFRVQFSEIVTDFDDLTDVSLSGTASASVTSITPLGGNAYDVLVTATTNGTVIATVPAGVAFDVASNPNMASTSTDNQVTYDTVAPVITLTKVNGSPVSFPYSTNVNVTSVGGACGTAVGDIATVNVTITGAASQTGSTACVAGTWTYSTSPALSAAGTYYVTATQSDTAGNTGTSGTKTIIIDKTAPIVDITKVNNSAVSFPFYTNANNINRLDGTCGKLAGDNANVAWSISGPASASGTVACTGTGRLDRDLQCLQGRHLHRDRQPGRRCRELHDRLQADHPRPDQADRHGQPGRRPG